MLIVAKIGGSLVKKGLSKHLVSDIKDILSKNRILLVHGGGSEVTEIASKLGKEQEFIVSPQGFRSRYTDKETVEIYTMVMVGKINKKIIQSLQNQAVFAIGLSGLDGLLVEADRKKRLIIVDERGRRRVIDGGYTGKIRKINTDLIHLLLKNGYIPVVSPVAVSEEFESLNVDGDRMAAYIAGSLKADRLILLTDVEGVTIDGVLAQKLSIHDVNIALPKIGHGMITKMHAATEALNMGVGEVVIASGLKDRPISSALEHMNGTVISHE